VQRVRQLFASILCYQYNAQQIDYGLSTSSVRSTVPVLMFLHGTTWASTGKNWPDLPAPPDIRSSCLMVVCLNRRARS
jgi:hypothetical protein